jgi:hypothetical protein
LSTFTIDVPPGATQFISNRGPANKTLRVLCLRDTPSKHGDVLYQPAGHVAWYELARTSNIGTAREHVYGYRDHHGLLVDPHGQVRRSGDIVTLARDFLPRARWLPSRIDVAQLPAHASPAALFELPTGGVLYVANDSYQHSGPLSVFLGDGEAMRRLTAAKLRRVEAGPVFVETLEGTLYVSPDRGLATWNGKAITPLSLERYRVSTVAERLVIEQRPR